MRMYQYCKRHSRLWTQWTDVWHQFRSRVWTWPISPNHLEDWEPWGSALRLLAETVEQTGRVHPRR